DAWTAYASGAWARSRPGWASSATGVRVFVLMRGAGASGAHFLFKSCELLALSYESGGFKFFRLGLYSRGMDRRTFLAASAAVLGQGLVGPAEMLAMAV